MFLVVISEFGYERGLIWGGNRAPLIQEIEYAQRVVIDELNYLDVIGELSLSVLILQALEPEDLLLLLEYLLQVDLVQSLVRIVDEELLKAVGL